MASTTRNTSPRYRRRPSSWLWATIALVITPATIHAANPTGRVVAVADGDTLTIRTDAGETVKVRLVGIDAPERAQPFGTKARERPAGLAMGKRVTLHDRGTDKYGRTLGDIEVDGRDVGRQIVSEGLAWHYKRFSDDAALAAAEAAARAARSGLWADRDHVPPREWQAI